MNVLDGPSIADLCDYDFGDQAGCIGGVPGAFMKKANSSNEEFARTVSGKKYMTLFIDNIRLYYRKITCNNDADQRHVDQLLGSENLLKLCESYPKNKLMQHVEKADKNKPWSRAKRGAPCFVDEACLLRFALILG